MEIFSEKVVIDSTLQEVWNYFIHLDHNGEKWMPGISKIEKESSGDITSGTKFSFYTRGKAHTSTITEIEEENKATLTSVQGGFRADYTYTFQRGSEGTEITLQANCEAKGFSKMFAPLVKVAIKKADSGQLTHFKEAFEGEKGEVVE